MQRQAQGFRLSPQQRRLRLLDGAANGGRAQCAVLIRGGSCIVAPLGQVLAGPLFGGEGILTADLDLAEIPRGKFDFDVAGHYARPDVFRLEVDTTPRRPVTFRSA